MKAGMMQAWRLSLALCALAASTAVGCASKSLVQRPWIQVSTANFQVMSSLDEQRTVKLARKLESFRAAVTQILGIPLPKRDIPARVYVFDDQEVWDQIAPGENLSGYFFQDWRHAVMAINAEKGSFDSLHIIQHEYTHKILRLSGAMTPSWYEEGLAEFLGTARLGEGTVKLGMPPARFGLLRIAQPKRFGPRAATGSHVVRDESKDPAVAGDVFYARAWARVDYLHLAHVGSEDGDDRQRQLHTFLQFLNQGRPHDEAFSQAFGMSFAQFDEHVDDFLRKDELPVVTIRVDMGSSGQPRVQPISQVQVARGLGELALGTGKLERANALLEHALAVDEGDARTLSALARVRALQERPGEARRLFESAIERAPRDPIPRLDYAKYLISTTDGAAPAVAGEAIENARVHIRVAIEETPGLPEPHALLGSTYVLAEDDRPHEGIRALARAAALLPRDGGIYYSLALLLVRAGELDQARALLRIVQRSAHGGTLADQARELLLTLGVTEQRR